MAYGIKIEDKEICGEKVKLQSLPGSANSERVVELCQQIGESPSLIIELGAILAFECILKDDNTKVFDSIDNARQSCSIGFLKELVNPVLTLSGMGDDAEELRGNLPADQ